MSVQRIVIRSLVPTIPGNISRIVLVSQSVTGPAAAGGSGIGDLLAINNLSELTATAAAARTNLGVAIGTNVQAFDAT